MAEQKSVSKKYKSKSIKLWSINDEERLIIEVSKHRCIFDAAYEDYSNKHVNAAIWLDIATFLDRPGT